MELLTIEELKLLNLSFRQILLSGQAEKKDVAAYIIQRNIPDIIEQGCGNYPQLAERIKKSYYQIKALQPDFCITPEDFKEHCINTANAYLLKLLNW